MPSLDVVLNAFVTLLVTVDPIGTAPLFLGLTVGLGQDARRVVARRAATIGFLVLALFAVTGTGVLDALGITIDAFRVAGGLLLFYTAFEMIYAKRQERKERTSAAAAEEHVVADVAVFPLAIPLIAGPGAISGTILLSSQMGADGGASHWGGIAALIGVLFVLMALTALTMIAAEKLDKYLGETGRAVLTRLLGVLLAALSIQYIADGARAMAGA